jgi:large subunit ribosomal protein L10
METAMAGYEAKLQDHKVEAISFLKALFSDSKDFIFADYRGLNVEQITELRNRLREKGSTFRVVKNRYAKIALNELEYPDVSEFLLGPTAMALADEDSGAAAKVLFEFSSDTSVSVKGAIIDGTVFDSAQVEAYSKLPTRDELIAQLLSVMQGPVRNLMYGLQAVPQKLVRTLQAVADKKGAE